MWDYDEIQRTVHNAVLARIDFTKQTSDQTVMDLIDEEIVRISSSCAVPVASLKAIRTDVFQAIRRLDVLQDLIDDPRITEIMINGTEDIFVERDGCIYERRGGFSSREKLDAVIQDVVGRCNRQVNEANPIVDARLSNGARVNVVLPPVALNGPVMTIRRFPEVPYSMDDLVRMGTLSEETADFLGSLVRAGFNLFISGGTGSGKTTFLNALSGSIPKDQRVITIEDSAELKISGIRNLVRLEARRGSQDGCTPVSLRDLIRTSLRMRPDRIIVGEVRGEEALDMVMAMNTGHDGSMSTGHGNSCAEMLSRLETMVVMGADLPLPAVQRQLADALDVMVHLGRLRDRTRKVLEIAEVTGVSEGRILLNPLYRFAETGESDGKIQGTWEKTGSLGKRDKLYAAGEGRETSPAPVPEPPPAAPPVDSVLRFPGGPALSDAASRSSPWTGALARKV